MCPANPACVANVTFAHLRTSRRTKITPPLGGDCVGQSERRMRLPSLRDIVDFTQRTFTIDVAVLVTVDISM